MQGRVDASKVCLDFSWKGFQSELSLRCDVLRESKAGLAAHEPTTELVLLEAEVALASFEVRGRQNLPLQRAPSKHFRLCMGL